MSYRPPEITELNGALRRNSRGWYWRDGEHEPRARDLLLEEIAPEWRRVRRGRLEWIEIPTDWRTTVEHDELIRAVTEMVRDYASIGPIDDVGAATAVGRRGHRRSGYRVPLQIWQMIMTQPIGATWEALDHEAILLRARELGYADPGVDR